MKLNYDGYLIGFSGGKDSVRTALWLLEQGVPADRIELHHHLVDGDNSTLMDWHCMPSYCKRFGEAFGIRTYHSYRVGGFEGEMNRCDQPTAAVRFELPDGTWKQVGGDSPKLGTRQKFPQTSADLSVRYCSPTLKIDVMKRLITNSPRFDGRRLLVLTGERREESAARAKYEAFFPHQTDARKSGRRYVDQLRPILDEPEARIWESFQRYRLRAAPPYWLNFSRCSCRNCIFASPDQLATIYAIDPAGIHALADYEKRFDCTIHYRRQGNAIKRIPILEYVATGTPYPFDPADAADALAHTYKRSIIMPAGTWQLPAGAFGKDKSGPT